MTICVFYRWRCWHCRLHDAKRMEKEEHWNTMKSVLNGFPANLRFTAFFHPIYSPLSIWLLCYCHRSTVTTIQCSEYNLQFLPKDFCIWKNFRIKIRSIICHSIPFHICSCTHTCTSSAVRFCLGCESYIHYKYFHSGRKLSDYSISSLTLVSVSVCIFDHSISFCVKWNFLLCSYAYDEHSARKCDVLRYYIVKTKLQQLFAIFADNTSTNTLKTQRRIEEKRFSNGLASVCVLFFSLKMWKVFEIVFGKREKKIPSKMFVTYSVDPSRFEARKEKCSLWCVWKYHI